MKRIFTTLAILAVAASSTIAADLPSKTTPSTPAPIFTQAKNYVGGNLGLSTAENYSAGIAVGTNILPYFAVEAAYDFEYQKDKINSKRNNKNELFVNAIPQYKIPGVDFTTYALGGIGYDFETVQKNRVVYNIGGGLKYDFAHNIEVDARYRYINAIDENLRSEDNRFSLGVNYKF